MPERPGMLMSLMITSNGRLITARVAACPSMTVVTS